MKSLFPKLILIATSSLLTLFVVDRVISFFPETKNASSQVTYPPFMNENIREHPTVSYTLRTNRLGIRYKDIPLEKENPQEIRVAVIGDSYTEGQGVEEDQTFSALLEKKFQSAGNPVFFINCGISGAGPFEHLRLLKEVALLYHPDKVILAIYANDIDDAMVSGSDPVVRSPIKEKIEKVLPQIYPRVRYLYRNVLHNAFRYLQRSATSHRFLTAYEDEFLLDLWSLAGDLGIERTKFDEWIRSAPRDAFTDPERKWFWNHRFGVLDSKVSYLNDCQDSLDGSCQKKWLTLRGSLNEFMKECALHHVKPAVLYLPYAPQYDHDYLSPYEYFFEVSDRNRLYKKTKLEENLETWAEEKNIPFLDLTEDFREASHTSAEPLNLRFDEHWNARGHKVAAGAIGKWLEEIHFLDR